MSFKCLAWRGLRYCLHSLRIKVNAALVAAIPMIDYAQIAYPSLREYLPFNVYAGGMVVLVLANIALHFGRKKE